MSALTALNPRIPNWNGQRVWIVGGSAGIGESLARNLHARGSKVAISARSADSLSLIAGECPGMASAVMDAGEPADWKRAFTSVCTQLGGLDLLVLCAAAYLPRTSLEIHAQEVRDTVNINLNSAYYAVECVLPTLLAQGTGGIAVVASVAGYMGLPQATVYGPTKAALINLAEILYQDLHPRGLGVYLMNPGFVRTRLTSVNSFKMPLLQTPDQAAEAIIEGMSRGRFEIAFPTAFTLPMKWVSMLPYRFRFHLLRNLIRS
jgi:short-subunit dehydrogenase